MAIHFIGITEEEFLKRYKRLYRFISIERFIESLENQEFTFVNPTLWADPYESFFLDKKFIIKNQDYYLPSKDKVFAVCLSTVNSSEAFWKVYTPKEDGIRLSFDTERLLTNLQSRAKRADIYIGKVEYTTTDDFNENSFKPKELIDEIERKIIGLQQINLLLKKRTSFNYENEVRIIIVPRNKRKDTKFLKLGLDIRDFTTGYMLDPRLGKHHAQVLKNYFRFNLFLRVTQSSLYDPLEDNPINLTKLNQKTILKSLVPINNTLG